MYNILICDDEPDIRSALKIYLSGEGYGIFEAENGSQALDIIAKEEISLLLMDVMMPVMDGITALSTLRKTSNIPVILLTAKSQDFDKVSGLNAGADDYITKPFVPVEVIARDIDAEYAEVDPLREDVIANIEEITGIITRR